MQRKNQRDRFGDRERALTKRPRELEDALNYYFYHPLSARLAWPLRKTIVTPNALSVLGAMCVVLAALSYGFLSYPLSVVLGLTLHVSWHILDGADGDLARLTGRASPAGEVVDGVCDYVSHIVLYVILAIVIERSFGPLAWLLVLLAGLSHAGQNMHYEIYRRQYLYWAYGSPWLRTSIQGIGNGSGVTAGYLRIAEFTFPLGRRIDRLVERGKIASHHEAADLDVIRQGLPATSLLGSNYRTLALGAAFAVQQPILFVIYEIIILNLVWAFAGFDARRRMRMLFEEHQIASNDL